MVKVTDRNCNFWKHYYNNAGVFVKGERWGIKNKGLLCRIYDFPLQQHKHAQEAEELASYIDLSPNEFENLMNKIRRHNTDVERRYSPNKQEVDAHIASARFTDLEVGICGAEMAHYML